MVIRNIIRAPLGIFDKYFAMNHLHPKWMNFYMLYMSMFLVLFLGRGVENLYMRGRHNDWERNRRIHRWFVPYSIKNYKWRFPKQE